VLRFESPSWSWVKETDFVPLRVVIRTM
jgi:hypothetical protein